MCVCLFEQLINGKDIKLLFSIYKISAISEWTKVITNVRHILPCKISVYLDFLVTQVFLNTKSFVTYCLNCYSKVFGSFVPVICKVHISFIRVAQLVHLNGQLKHCFTVLC